jgi:hypothetical protein
MRNYLLLLFLFLLMAGTLHSQTEVSGSLNGYIYNIIDNMPGRDADDYSPPSQAMLEQWEVILDTMLVWEDYEAAATLAGDVGYELVHLQDGGEAFYILRMKEGSLHYWGTYVMRPQAGDVRKVVIQSPHPKFDMNTGKEGIYVFRKSGVYAFCLAGTHRCNSTYFSPCDGTTTVCNGTSQPYRTSDMAHNVGSVFELTTEVLARHDPALVFIQLHGFAMRDTDPYVIMSNGTRLTPQPDWLDSLKNALKEADAILDFRVAHQDLGWSRLIAFNNVQGRYLNGSSDICKADADTVSGRFIHIEQEKSRLREDSIQWEKMVYAVNHAFPLIPQGVEEHEVLHVMVSPNPFDDHAVIIWQDPAGKYDLSLYTVTGREVRHLKGLTGGRVILHRDGLPRGLYFFIIRDNNGKRFAGRVMVGGEK